jgi:hypothetical protein
MGQRREGRETHPPPLPPVCVFFSFFRARIKCEKWEDWDALEGKFK